MDHSLVCLVVGIGEENQPIRWEGGVVNGKAVVLGRDEASFGRCVDARLVVATVTISEGEERIVGHEGIALDREGVQDPFGSHNLMKSP